MPWLHPPGQDRPFERMSEHPRVSIGLGMFGD